MIDAISIEGIATYRGDCAEVRDLAEFNFFYGANGSGKTTISRVIADAASHPTCSLTWKNGRAMETLVYNRDFITTVFTEADDLPGIFSLGEDSAKLLSDIEEAKDKVKRLTKERDQLKVTLDGEDGKTGKRGELVVAKESLRDACWLKRANLGDACREAFRGFLNDKAKFVDEVLRRQALKSTKRQTKEYLTQRGETIFGDQPLRVAPLAGLDCAKLSSIGEPALLKKPIVGKKDVDIDALIEKLGNSDWVKQGQAFLDASEDLCPFCQQQAPSSLRQSLNDYFDETYINGLAEIEALQSAYRNVTDELLAALDALLAAPAAQLDATTLKDKRDTLAARIMTNRARLANKMKEPSSIVEFESTQTLAAEITGLVEAASVAIASHNTLVSNYPAERKKLVDECWTYLIDDELATELRTYGTKKEAVNKAIDGIETKLRALRTELTQATESLLELQRKTTSIEPTIASINGVLRSFGFEGFQLAAADAPHCYKLVRADGSAAKNSLSEGERSFITFLYFYNLLQGSHDQSGATDDRIVVFDDPVSSLDSDVLFIVSTLIKRLQQEVLSEKGPLKQLFVLTHNVYFHKEVTFDSQRKGVDPNSKTFWMVRKCKGQSGVIRHATNPVKTGYDLLWAELREESRSTVAIQNAMRRILEHYFKVLGGRNPLDICEEFDGADQLVCRSLLSWINDGSHHASDDLYQALDQETIENYERVFKLIFERTNHMGHYEMMMGTPPAVNALATVV